MQLNLIDNGPDDHSEKLQSLIHEFGLVGIVTSSGNNIGFGAGHNLVLSALGEFHLILNPDAELATDALAQALKFMNEHPECGLLTPSAHYDNEQRQYLCKRYPSLFSLVLRGFAPAFLRKPFERVLSEYEMRDLINDHDVVWDPPIVSGCFMLFRSEVLRQLKGFDPRYFLYFEDFDLSLRAGKVTRIAYVPCVRIVHHGGNAARKGLKHIWMFAKSAFLFFNTHGWKFF